MRAGKVTRSTRLVGLGGSRLAGGKRGALDLKTVRRSERHADKRVRWAGGAGIAGRAGRAGLFLCDATALQGACCTLGCLLRSR